MNMTVIRYNAGCQKIKHSAIAAAIETHSPAVASRALAGCSADSSLIVTAGRRSGIVLLVLCGCTTIGFAEMSSTGFSDRRKAIALVSFVTGGINPLPGPSDRAIAHTCVYSWAFKEISALGLFIEIRPQIWPREEGEGRF